MCQSKINDLKNFKFYLFNICDIIILKGVLIMNYYGGYNTPTTDSFLSTSDVNGIAAAGVWIIIAFVLAIIGAFLVYFLFVKSDKKIENKFVAWLREFLDFNSMLIETIMKIAYIFIAIFITLGSFALISSSFVSFLLVLIFGNIIARVTYEFVMITISIWKNTRDINRKMK